MKAIVYRDYGSPDVLRCEEIEKPIPGDNEVLIRVRAASVNPLDWKLMKGGPFPVRVLLGLGKPKVKRPGVDVAGVVEAIGRKGTQFKPGDAVFGTCRGAFAEYAISASVLGMKSVLVKKPDNVTFEQAASVPVAALTALQGLRDKGRIQPGQSVLVNGAAGGVGTFAVQIAKVLGANVTGVCGAGNVDMVRSIGADRVIDYTREDFTTGKQRYDVLLDCVGNHSLFACRRILNRTGRLVLIGAPSDASVTALLARTIGALVLSLFPGRKMCFFIAKVNSEDLTVLSDLMATGKIKAVIDKRYRLSDTAGAFRYAEKGHARGKVVVTVEDGDGHEARLRPSDAITPGSER
ncbi:NAD(P)-dependent alcohol dehydrogenase [Alloacidobacterium dinghuense]|uniref:NAD(P)-dependent alcohol dehydrogenase n=1 Tax=Alloacidobacterium dinghuense TaxID=2763107 RepID=A0A7G8BG37_9BACT|nr:NAD(P)-dependent alcohol dehydrogenase [Alloacidobacterium dinghuense]QNI31507.1 NAD(P)-dependent alcohol dehydrogenase [Alloacidobacterium dinghuense]